MIHCSFETAMLASFFSFLKLLIHYKLNIEYSFNVYSLTVFSCITQQTATVAVSRHFCDGILLQLIGHYGYADFNGS